MDQSLLPHPLSFPTGHVALHLFVLFTVALSTSCHGHHLLHLNGDRPPGAGGHLQLSGEGNNLRPFQGNEDARSTCGTQILERVGR